VGEDLPERLLRGMFRLKGMNYPEDNVQRPPLFGKLTNDIVYDRLAPGVLDELRRVTPRNEEGRPTRKFHQSLTNQIGHPKLVSHLGSVVTLMKLSDNWPHFMTLLDRIHPRLNKTIPDGHLRPVAAVAGVRVRRMKPYLVAAIVSALLTACGSTENHPVVTPTITVAPVVAAPTLPPTFDRVADCRASGVRNSPTGFALHVLPKAAGSGQVVTVSGVGLRPGRYGVGTTSPWTSVDVSADGRLQASFTISEKSDSCVGIWASTTLPGGTLYFAEPFIVP